MTKRAKIAFALIVFIVMPFMVSGQEVTINLRQARLETVLDTLEALTGCTFYYTEPPIDINRRMDISAEKTDIREVLNDFFSGTNIDVKINGKKVYLSEKSLQDTQVTTNQPLKYTGVVTDAEGEPVFGARVVIKGTTIYAVTDFDGRFHMETKRGTIIVISSLGYADEEITLGEDTDLSIMLSTVAINLEDVVVVGYSTRSREKLISSVSNLQAKELVKSEVPNLENALSGKVAGVFSRQTSGEPGMDNANLTIRGFGTALVVVDGIPGRNYSDLDPNEIESISVLKDASAAAVYGMQGANGVILVTTKRGAHNKPAQIEATAKFTIQQPARYPKTADYNLYNTLLNEYNINRKLLTDRAATATAEEMAVTPGLTDTDWYSEMFRAAPSAQANLNITGGTDKIRYFVSGGYLFQGGVWTTNATSKNRFNLRSNLDADLAEGLKASVGVGIVVDNMKYPFTYSSMIARYIGKAAPSFPVRWNEDDEYYAFNGEGTFNPRALADRDAAGYRDLNERSFTVDATLEYKIPFFEGLSVKANLGYSFNNSYQRSWGKVIPYIGYYDGFGVFYESASASYADKADMTVSTTDYNNLVFQGYLNYDRTFNTKHTVNAGLVYELNSATNNYFYTSRFNYPSVITDRLYAGLSGANLSDGESIRTYHSVSVVERFSYDYRSKYFIDINCRLDGAQYFSRKWGLFPSVSLGWMMTNESWMKEVKNVIQELKVRASYGVLGDLSAAKSYYDNYEMYYYQSGYKYPGSEMTYGDRTILSLEQTINANPDFTWSTSTIANIGVDFKLFSNSLLTGSAEAFYRKREGLPAMMANDNAGALATYYNINDDNTRGIDLSLNHSNKIGEVSYSIGTNFSWSRTRYGHVEHTEYASGYTDWLSNTAYRWTNIRWGYKVIGRYQTYEEIDNSPMHPNTNNNTVILPGDLKYEDYNGDGYIDDKDIQPIGRTSYPEIMYGINMSASWRDFDFSLFLQGATLCQFTISSYDQFAFENGRTQDNCWAYFQSRWHKADYSDPNSEWIPGDFPAIRDWQDKNINNYASDFWMFDGTYLRVKNIELGYTFPIKSQDAGSQSLSMRLYASAYNPFTFAAQKYFDPEVPSSAYTFASYPQIKSYIIGLNVKF